MALTYSDFVNTLKTVTRNESPLCEFAFGQYVNTAPEDSVFRSTFDMDVIRLYKPQEAALDARKLTDDDLAELEFASEKAGFYAGWRAATAYMLARMQETLKTA